MHRAAAEGDVSRIKHLVDLGYDVNSVADGETPLCIAVRSDHLETVQVLLNNGANPNMRGKVYPLHIAATSPPRTEELAREVSDREYNDNRREIMRLLLAAGAMVDAMTDRSRSALNLCCDQLLDRSDLVTVLIEAGANVYQRDHCGFRRDMYTDIPVWRSVQHAAAQRGHVHTLMTLLSAGASVDAADCDGNRPLHSAAMNGYVETVRALLDAGADVNARNRSLQTALHLAACCGGHSLVLQTLLSANADVNARDCCQYTALDSACARGNISMMRVLLFSANPQIDQSVLTLQLAVMSRSAEAVKMLLTAGGVSVNAVDHHHRAALHFAMTVDVAEALITAGADINAEEDYRCTPLHVAAGSGNREVVKVLLRYGARVWQCDDEGRTASERLPPFLISHGWGQQLTVMTRQVCRSW